MLFIKKVIVKMPPLLLLIAVLFPKPCWKVNCLDTRKAVLPELSQCAKENLNLLMAALFFLMRSAKPHRPFNLVYFVFYRNLLLNGLGEKKVLRLIYVLLLLQIKTYRMKLKKGDFVPTCFIA